MIDTETCTCTCTHADYDHLDGGCCQVYGCLCEELEFNNEPEDMSGVPHDDGTNNER